MTSEQQRERFLLKAVEEFPAGDRDKVDLGLGVHLELGLFYLDHERLEEAERFFSGVVKDPVSLPAYKTLGRLGEAVVLARRNHPGESNRILLELLKDARGKKSTVDRFFLLLNRPELRRALGLALEYNKANAGDPLPAELETLRQPPRWLAPRPRPGPPSAPGKAVSKR